MSKRDYYEVLGISKSASSSEIKKAYLKLAKKYHPDRNAGDATSEKKFKEAGEAYDVLKDEQKKASYDRFGHNAFGQGGTTGSSGGFGAHGGFSSDNMNDIFSDIFSDFMGGSANQRSHRRSTKIKGSDLKYNLTITLEEAFNGVDKNISFTADTKCESCSGHGTKDANKTTTCMKCGGAGAVRMQQGFFTVEQTCNKCSGVGQVIKNPCKTCSGTGRSTKQKHLIVNVPSGIENNTRIRIAGEGEAGIRGGNPGDLYVFINIKQHNTYQVDGNDLHFKLPISFTKAILGSETEILTINGSKIKLQIPRGTETGNKIRLKGMGMPKVRSSMRGDLYAHAYIKIPKKITKEQEELVKKLDQSIGDIRDNDKNEGFFDKVKNIWS